jgi:hypothetical protein
MAVEELKYTILVKDDKFQIRQYAPHVVAQVRLEGNFEGVGNAAFGRLAGYIFGQNRRRNSLAMTAPVIQEPGSEKMAMTAPVNQQKSGNAWIVSFVMPSAYTMDNLPEPLDSAVELVDHAGRLTAALTYSGGWQKSRFEEKKRLLEAWLAEQNYIAAGEAIFARYNSPFALLFFRRNEVLIPVEKKSSR